MFPTPHVDKLSPWGRPQGPFSYEGRRVPDPLALGDLDAAALAARGARKLPRQAMRVDDADVAACADES